MSIDVIGTQIDHTEQAPVVLGSEKIPTGGRGLYHVTVDQVRDYVLTYFGKESIRLGEVDNTSDEDKPLSRATREALSKKLNKSDQFVRSINGLTGDIDLVPTVLGLGNVDNTADKDKPLSEVAIRALSTKLDKVTFKDFKRVFHIFEQQVYDKFTKLDEIDTQLLNRVSQLEEADIEITKTLQDLTKYLNRELARISSTLSEEQMKIVSNYLGANFDNLLKTSSWLPLRLNKLHQDILISINVVRAITDNLAVNDTNLKNQLDSLIVQLNSRISKINEDLSNINSKVSSNENVINRQFVEAREYFDQQINGLLPLIQGAADKYLRDLSDFQQTVDDVTRTLHNSVANVQTQIDVQSVVTESLNQALNSKHEILLDMMASQGKTLEDLIDSATQSARNDMRDLGYRMQDLDYNYERKYQSMEGVLETQVESTKQLVKKQVESVEQLVSSQVAQVNSDIEAVKTLATNLENQAQSLVDKYEEKLTEITEATLSDVTELLQESLQQETLNRNQAILDAVLKESHDRVDAIKLESTARNNAIEAKVSEINSNIATQINSVQDGINKEVIDRTDAVSTVRGEIESYKSSNNNAVATALQKIEAVTTENNSTVTALNALQSTFKDLSDDLLETTSDISTFKQTVADANSALASSVDNLSTTLQNNNTEVNGRISVVETSVTTLEENVNTKTSQLQSSLDTTQGSVNEALEAISTKADANTVDTLESKVTSIDGKVTSQGSSITELTNELAVTKEKVNTKADSSALSSLTNEVTTLDGKILAQSNAITDLQSQATNIENNLETKVEATALSDYYTKAETDTISAGKLEEFKAGLKLGGTNLIPNSNLFSVGDTSDQNLLREILPNGNLKITNKGMTLQTYLAHFYDASTTFEELLKLQDGDDFTTSVWVKAVNADILPTVLPLLYFSDLLSYEEMEGDLTQLSSGKEVVYIQTRKFVKDVTNISPHFQLSHHSVGGGIIITKWQIEKGTIASDWSPSNQEVRDILNANTVAINNTNTETSRINELVTTQGSSISSLEGNLQLVDVKLGVAITNAATAQSTANTAINNVESTADSLNKLSSKFEVSALAANNLLINSNESKVYDGTYPHHVYILTEPWEVDATYTLLWCAEHRQNESEPYSSLSVYAGGGQQDVQTLRQTDGKVVSKTTFIKTNSGLSPGIHFYLINQPPVSEGTVATVYWAVLVKGETITTDRWIPSSKEYIPQISVTNANITTLSKTLTDADTALSRRIDTLTSSVNNDNEVISGKINDVASSVSTLDGNTTTKFTTLESNVSALENNVAKKLDATIIDDYYTKTESNSAISGQLTQFKSSLDIGGTNLLLNTQYLNKELPPTIVGGSSFYVQGIAENYGAATASGEGHFVITDISDERFIRLTADVGLNNTLKPNGTYTFSLKVRGAAKPLKFRMITFLPTGWVDLLPLDELDYINDTFSKHSYTFTVPANTTRFILSLQSYSPNLGESFAILNSSMKLEEGTVATTWAPATGDIQDSLKSNSIAINTVNTEVARVGNLVTTQSTSISKLQSDLAELDTKTGQAITNAATAQQTANTAVTNDQATAERVDSLTTTVANNNTTVTGKINDVATSVTTLEGNTNSKISSLESSLSIISSVITISSAIDISKDLTIMTDVSPGEITKIVNSTATGGQVLSIGNNESNDCVWARSTQVLTIEPNRMYRLRARLRVTAGTTGTIYLGVGCLTADKASYVNTYNSLDSSLGSSNYLLGSERPPIDTWMTYEYFLQGKSTGTVTGSGTIQDPRTFAPLAAFASPMFIVNYPSASGTVEIDYITLEIADDLKETRGTSTALASLTTQVNTVDGNVVTLSNDLTTLKGATTALENNVAKKLDASVINDYFTKTESTSAIAGQLTQFKTGLSIGGSNLLTNTKTFNKEGTVELAKTTFRPNYASFGTAFVTNPDSMLWRTHTVIQVRSDWCGFYYSCNSDNPVDWIADQDMTLSVWVKNISNATVNAYGIAPALGHVASIPSGEWQRIVMPIEKGRALRNTANQGLIEFNFTSTEGAFYYAAPMLQYGNVATAWQPSALDSDFDATQFASATYVQNIESNVTAIDGRVTANTNSLANLNVRVDNTQADLVNNYYTKSAANEATSGQIITMRSQLAYGARNFVRNTGAVFAGWYWMFQQPITTKLQGEVTISFDVEVISNGAHAGAGVGFNMGDKGTSGYKYEWYPDFTNSGHFSHTLTVNSENFTHFGIFANNEVRITKVMVQLGKVEFPWSPAPEDLSVAVSANATAIQNTYTKTEANTATAGQIATFEASLALGGGILDVGRSKVIKTFEFGSGTITVTERKSNSFKIDVTNNGLVSAYISLATNSEKLPIGTSYVFTGKVRTSRSGAVDLIYSRINQFTSDSYIYGEVGTEWQTFTAKGVTNTSEGNPIHSLIGAKMPAAIVGDWVEFKDCRVSVNTDEMTIANANSIQAVVNEVSEIEGNLQVLSQKTEKFSASIANAKLPTILNEERVNQWHLTVVVPHKTLVGAPTYEHLDGATFVDERYVYDDALTLYNVDNSTLYFRAIVYCDTARTITGTLLGDDAHAVYVEGIKVFESGGYSSNNISFHLPAGLSTIDMIASNGGGPGGFSLTPLLSNQVTWLKAVKSQGKDNADAIRSIGSSITNIDGRVTANANQTTSLQAKLDQRKIYRLYSGGLEAATGGWGFIQGFNPDSMQGIGRSYGLVVFAGDGSIQSVNSYDVFGGQAQPFIDAVAAVPIGTWVAVLTSDEPNANHHFLVDSVKSLGGTEAINQLVGRGAYLLVGRKGSPIGTAIELVSNTTQFGCTYMLEMFNGVPTSLGGTSPQAGIVSQMRSEVTNNNGVVNAISEKVGTLETSVSGYSAKIEETNSTVNGIKVLKTVAVDNNGVLSGYGLVSELVNGQVTSAFGINADQFYIGAPSSGKKPFTVLTSPGTVNGIPVPAGTYIDTAYIADATITSAKIQELNGAKITAGSIKAEQLSVQSLSALNAKIGTITTTGSQGSMTISDSLIEIRDSSGKIRVRLGIW